MSLFAIYLVRLTDEDPASLIKAGAEKGDYMKKQITKPLLLLLLSGLLFSAHAGISIVHQDDQGFFVPKDSSGTSSYVNVSAQAGDVIVLTASTNKKGDAAPLSAAQVGGTGLTDAQTLLSNLSSTYPTSWIWYYTVTNIGTKTFSFDIRTGNTAGITAQTALYVLRADSGTITEADTATWDDADTADNGSSYSLNYSFTSTLTNSVLIESVSTRTDDINPPAAYTVDISADNSKGLTVRSLLSYEGVSGSSWTSSYTIAGGDSAKQTHGAAGIVFAEDPWTGGNHTPQFDSDPVPGADALAGFAYSDTLASHASDADNDPLTFSKGTGGPAWLSVATNGILSGTPQPSDTGTNLFTVSVTDNQGAATNATLKIVVDTSGFYPVPLDSSNLYVQGAAFANIDKNGLNFHRFDSNLLNNITAVNVNATRAKTTSGVKLSFYTRSDTVRLTFDYVVGDEYRNSSKFTTYQNGTYVSTPAFSLADPVEGATRFVMELQSTGSPGDLIRYDVVFPNWANPILSAMELKTNTVLEAGNPIPTKKLVVLGDSISHGTGQGTTAAGYPCQVAEALDMELFNMAVGGGKIAPEVADLLQYFEPVDAIWVLVGFNDWQGASKSIETISNDYETLLATIRRHQPDAELFCCTLVATTLTNDLESGVTVDEVRQAVADVVNARISAGDKKLHLVRGEEPMSSSDASYTLNTIVHFTELGAADFASNVVAVMDPILNPASPQELYLDWTTNYPSLGSATNLTDNPDSDQLNNLSEYALGCDPTIGAKDPRLFFQPLEKDGTNYLEYVYVERSDAKKRGLTYQLQQTSGLIDGTWSTNGFIHAGTGVLDGQFNWVTNRVKATNINLFIRLRIAHQEI